MTAGERLIQQGFLQGFLEAREEAREEGMRGLLLRQLRRRFGNEVDGEVERRVRTAPVEQIGTWAERLLSATTLAELFTE
jgi:hypothetical protein